jgi:hypothetical protein
MSTGEDAVATGEVGMPRAAGYRPCLSDDRSSPCWAGLFAKSPVFRGFIAGRSMPRPYGISASSVSLHLRAYVPQFSVSVLPYSQ